jgi:hypothetical protein
MIYTCLSISIPLITFERLERLEVVLSTRAPCPRRDHLLHTIRQLRYPAEISAVSLLGKRKRDPVSCRTEVHATVTDWFSLDNPVWISNTGELSDTEWCGQIIEAISDRLPMLVLLISCLLVCQLLTVIQVNQ